MLQSSQQQRSRVFDESSVFKHPAPGMPRTNASLDGRIRSQGYMMVKRKCGTCKYFQDRGLASSGWCRHPERCDIQDMVLVRKAELACRNGWDRDLWEPAAASEAPARVDESSHLQIPNPPPSMRRTPVRSLTPVVLPAAPKMSDQGDLYTDKITSIRMSAPPRPEGRQQRVESLPVMHAVPQHHPGLSPEESRRAVREERKRREEARKAEMRQEKETIVRTIGELLDEAEDDQSSGQLERPADGHLRSQPPIRPSTPPIQSMGPAADSTPMTPAPRGDTTSHSTVTFPASPPRFDSPASSAGARGRRDDVHSTTLPSALLRGSEKKIQKTEPLPQLDLDSRVADKSRNHPADDFRGMQQVRSGGRDRFQAPSLGPHSGERPGSGTSLQVGAGTVPTRSTIQPAPIPMALEHDPIDVSPVLKNATRCCDTCRDFKRAGDGTTGWCANPYAFPERRMVHAKELACRSSIGVWWLPHDDLWLDRADVTHHGRPTPNLDEELRLGHVSRQGMGPRSS